MEHKEHEDVYYVRFGFLAAALLSWGIEPLLAGKTQDGQTFYCYPRTKKVGEMIRKYDNQKLLVPVNFHDTLMDMHFEPYDWESPPKKLGKTS